MAPVLRFLAFLAAAWALWLSAAPAADLPGELRPGGSARVEDVIDGDTVLLDDGRQVRLVGIQAPKLPLGRPNYPTWPLAPEAKAALRELLLGEEVTLGFGGAERDRNGRVLAHLFREPDGLWIQGEMLRRGLARVYTFADNRALAGRLYEQERAARLAGMGLWALAYYAVLAPEAAGQALDQFAVVEGRVLSADERRGTGYLNFGSDWKSDFTAVIRPEASGVFAQEGIDVAAYEGRRIRVRGWVESLNGPMIEVTHPEQIEEVLE